MLSDKRTYTVAVISPLDESFAATLQHLAETDGLTCRTIDSDIPGQDVFDTDFLSSFIAGSDVVVCNTLTTSGRKEDFWMWNVSATRAVCVATARAAIPHLVMIANDKINDDFKADDDPTTLLRSLFRGEMEAAQAAELGLDVAFVRSSDPEETLLAIQSFDHQTRQNQ